MQANSVNLDIKRVVAYRHWCNKLWNAVRFAMMNLGDSFRPAASLPSAASLPFACHWILSRLSAATEATVSAFETYAFSAASQVRDCWESPAAGSFARTSECHGAQQATPCSDMVHCDFLSEALHTQHVETLCQCPT